MNIERLSIELTRRCAKACWFCYSGSGPEGATQWTVEDVAALVRDGAARGLRAVSFGGGEPLEYEGLFELLGRLRGVLFRSLTTNGLLLDAAMLERLAEAAPDKVHVSIHFPGSAREVERVIAQVQALEARGIRSGINLLVTRSRLDEAIRAAGAVRAAGIGNERIVYLPMRGQDTPSPEELGRVAGSVRFQSMSCLLACGSSPRFCSLGWDRTVAWCSYTRSRRPLAEPSWPALLAALEGLGLEFCGSAGTDVVGASREQR